MSTLHNEKIYDALMEMKEDNAREHGEIKAKLEQNVIVQDDHEDRIREQEEYTDQHKGALKVIYSAVGLVGTYIWLFL